MEYRGKHICEVLKGIRKQIAEANNIDYIPSVCNHKGDCSGTCPMCEKEKSFLEQQIGLKQKAGQAIKIVGIATGLTALAAQPLYANNQEVQQEDVVMNWDAYFFDFSGGPFPSNEAVADEMAEFIAANPHELYVVIGKTDQRGSEKYNLKLSQKRAEYICSMLKARIENTNVTLVPVGASFYEPSIANAQDEAEHEKNRKCTLETYAPKHHTGKVAALIEYAICKALGVTLPQKIEQEYTLLNEQPYDENTMKGKYDVLAEKMRKLREK